jgi:hypothetical protein
MAYSHMFSDILTRHEVVVRAVPATIYERIHKARRLQFERFLTKKPKIEGPCVGLDLYCAGPDTLDIRYQKIGTLGTSRCR